MKDVAQFFLAVRELEMAAQDAVDYGMDGGSDTAYCHFAIGVSREDCRQCSRVDRLRAALTALEEVASG